MDKSFYPATVETTAAARWNAAELFEVRGEGPPYTIFLPPPNVTGTLHMGHAFQQTLMDVLVRAQRMRGRRTLWQGGTDHAGIATQKIVENQLAAAGSSRAELGREAFVERVWQWKAQSGSTIGAQMRRLGTSVAWSRDRFTMDEGLSSAVRKVFIDWYRAGLIYRGKRLVHWDPVLRTAVSDLEVESVDKPDGKLYAIRYPAVDGGPGVVVATTRPETLLGDVAVAVHPDDERYRALVGLELELPLTGRRIPVIADNYVDPAFGSGAVKITPAHDFNDFQIGQRHGLAPIVILDLDARICEPAPMAYVGLDRFEARKRVLADLTAQGLLVEERTHAMVVPVSQRSDAITEPMLTDQWFVDLTREQLADGRPGGRAAITQPALEAVSSGEIRFVPESWATTYIQWLEGIQDWCISRQLWWGHRIPAWYDEAGQIYVGHDLADALAHGQATPVGQLTQDPDVLDTWFSSALWPFSTLGWPGDSPERAAEWAQFERHVPSDVLITGFDIIFFWVARMVMATRYYTGRVPFREVYINAIVRDADGQKMSKSKGNTIDPLDLIDGIELNPLVDKATRSLLNPRDRERVEKRLRRDYPDGISAVGADALRFTFCALAGYSRTINFDLKRCEGYRAFCNKLWNAARFVLLNTEDYDGSGADAAPSIAVRWARSQLARTIAEFDSHLASYRFDLLAQSLYEYTWNNYCDWLLELAKPALQGGDRALRAATQHALLDLLGAQLKLLHPLIPFITEEIHAALALRVPNAQVLALSALPSADQYAIDADAEAEIGWLQQVLLGLRRIRAELNLAPSREVELLVSGGDAVDLERLERFATELKVLARIGSLASLPDPQDPPAAALATVGMLQLRIPLAGLVDPTAERARLKRELDKIDGERRKSAAKLENPKFVDSAPAAVVDTERARLADWVMKYEALAAELARLDGL